MKFKALGRTGLKVSELCFGTMSFGGDADEATSGAMYKACRDAGINFFDTADQYSKGKSEEILGRLIKGHRDDVIIATKCFNPTGEDRNARGLSRRHVSTAVEASLRRLQVDRVEILYLHHQDRHTPIEETLRALEDLVRAGKVLHPALSNYSAWQAKYAVDYQQARDWAPMQVLQPMYSLVKRQAEVEILPMALNNGIAVCPYSPAGAGVLSGKYSGGATGRLKSNKMYEARYGEPWVFEVADKFVALCKSKGMHPVSAAIAWCAAHPGITAPIVGSRSVEQLKGSLNSVKIEMTPALYAEIAALSPSPPPATDRLEEVKPPRN